MIPNMQVKVIVPSGLILDQEAAKLVAEAPTGSFGLWPGHIDYVSALACGILGLTAPDGSETFLAVDEGVLVKQGSEVLISAFNAVQGPLGELRNLVRQEFVQLDEHEAKARLALSRLEASLVHQIVQREGGGRA